MAERPPEVRSSPYGEPTRVGSVLRVIGGCVLVGIVVGAGLWAERATDDDLALPDEVSGLAVDDSSEAREFAAANSARLAEAYDDAEAVSATYEDGDTRVLVTAVTVRSGPPVPAVIGADQEWVEDGEVTCLAGKGTGSDGPILCQRDGGDLTVRTYAEGGADVDTLVDITNDVWEDLS